MLTLNRFKILGVTIAFFFVAVVEAAVAWGLTETGHGVVPGHGVDNWLVLSAYIVGYAVFAGLMVDLSRWIVFVLWRPIGKPRHSAGNHARREFA